jgi:urate oxidase
VIELAANRYGKSAIRVVRVDRSTEPHRIWDLTVDVALEGDFADAHVAGDNAKVVATDTMKNTVYAFARDRLGGSIEAYGRALAEHFVTVPQVESATVDIRQAAWIPAAGRPDSFVRDGSFGRLARVVAVAGGSTSVEAGLADLIVMKTARSAFGGFPRDRYTTLPDTRDRLMASKLTARWRYGPDDVDHDALHRAVTASLLEAFGDHDSESVQHTIWVVGREVLERHADLVEITLEMPNLHHWLVDLSPFGLDNPGEVFVATSEPHGLIRATVRRGGSPSGGGVTG